MSALDSEVDARFSLARERSVARKYIGRVQWEMILWGLGQFGAWFVILVLGIQGRFSLWLGFPLATVLCCLAYLPSHEAQHGNIAGKHESLRWLNDLVGHVSLLNLNFPYSYARATHMQHHAFTNDPERDTDHHYVKEHWWQAALAVHRDPPREMLERHAQNNAVFEKDLVRGVFLRQFLCFVQLVCALLWPLPVFFLWWLPQKIGLSYLTIFLSWMPHRPGVATDRYHVAHFWQTKFVSRYFVQSMTHHAVHHLYPRIPHWSQPAALAELRPFIEARGMDGAEILPDYK